MKIIAIDPGYERLGIAVLEKIKSQKEVVIFSECFKTPVKMAFTDRLNLIGSEITKIIKEYSPEALSIETLFFNTNQTTAMHVAEARGTILYLAASYGLAIKEFTPLQIKIAVTGHGRSDKKQVISMIERLVVLPKKIAQDDEYDAIACGLTFFAHHRTSSVK